MSRITRSLAVLVFGGATLLASTSAADAATITPTPGDVVPGGSVRITGDVLANGTPGCDVPGTVTLISDVFAGQGEFAGVPAVEVPVDAAGNFDSSITIDRSVLPGTYTISGRCGGGNLGIEATIVVDSLPATGSRIPVAPSLALGATLIALGSVAVSTSRRRTAPIRSAG